MDLVLVNWIRIWELLNAMSQSFVGCTWCISCLDGDTAPVAIVKEIEVS